MAQEPRHSQRVNAEVPVRLVDRSSGVTRDVSPSGIYFVVTEKLQVGEQIRFSVEFEDPSGGVLHLDCIGSVVRVEENEGKLGVAVALSESKLERRGRP